ncbi:MAG: tetratricopeptide (TPR) repeat protein [Gammaproteobacteria bacterium]|jgi:tetratricopeptide (TPR) repeat protein
MNRTSQLLHKAPMSLAQALIAMLLSVATQAWAADSRAQVIDELRKHMVASSYAQVEQSARAALVHDFEAADIWHLLGDALSARGRTYLALDAYSQALQHASSRPLALQVSMARIHLGDARDDDAQVLLQSVLGIWRTGGVDDAHELIAVAQAALTLGRGDPALKRTALQVYEEAINHAPNDAAAYIGLGELLLSSYNNAEAVPLFDKALQLAAQDPRALLAMARSQHFEHAPEALQSAQAAVDLAPGWAAARVFLAQVMVRQENPRAAQEQLEAALAANPRSVEALSLLAALRDRDGDQESVDKLMSLVLIIAPRYSEGFAILAQMAADRRRYQDAVHYAAQAIKIDARNWRAHALAGMNQLRLGNNAAARLSLETAFRGDPFNVWTKNTLDLLDAMDTYAVLKRGRFVLTGRADQVNVLAPYLFALAEQAFDVHAITYGVQPATPIRIEVHPQRDDLSVRTLGTAGVDLLGVSFGPTLVIDGPMLNPGGPFNWASVLWHELAHSFQLELSRGRAPRWLAEGMAVHDEHNAGYQGWGQDIGPGFLQAYLQGRLAKASQLNDRFVNPQAADDVGNAYLQAGLLVAMIDRDHGSGSLPALLLGYRDGRATQQLLGDVLGVSAEQFDADFDDYLRQRFGAALDALKSPESSSQADTGEPADTPPSSYAQLLRSAVEALSTDDLQVAETALLKARALVPGHTGEHGPHRLLIDVYRRKDELPRVIDSERALLRVDADDLGSLLSLADDLQKAGDERGAIDALRRAVLIQPFDAPMHTRLAVLLEAVGEWQAARVERAAVVALGATDTVDAHYRLAIAASRSGDLAGARRAVLAALENAPLFEDGLMLLLTVREQLASSRTPTDRARGGTAAEGRQR